MPIPQSLPFSYRKDLEGLRGVAMVGVVFFHAFPSLLNSGFIGVDIFFVLSGYLITSIVQRDRLTQHFKLWDFFSHRINRLAPVLILALLSNLWWTSVYYPIDFYQAIATQTIAAASFSLNDWLAVDTSLYGDSNNANPLLHIWSLGIEAQFYLLWALLLYGAFFIRYRYVVLGVVVLILASITVNTYLGIKDSVWAFYSVSARLWEFSVGALTALAIHHSPLRISAGIARLLASVGLLLWIAAVYIARPNYFFPLPSVLLPVLATACLIAAGPKAWLSRYVLTQPILLWLGRISYAMYVWHWLLFAYVNQWYRQWNETVPWWVYIAAIGMSAVLAYCSHVLIEKPIRQLRHTHGYLISLGCMIALAALAGLSWHQSIS